MRGAVGLVQKNRQVTAAHKRVRCKDAGDLVQTQRHPGSSWLPPPIRNPPLIKTEQTDTKHLAIGVAIEIHTSEVVTDHGPLPKPIRTTVDDSEPAGEKETESLLKLSGPAVTLQQRWHLRMLSLRPSQRIR